MDGILKLDLGMICWAVGRRLIPIPTKNVEAVAGFDLLENLRAASSNHCVLIKEGSTVRELMQEIASLIAQIPNNERGAAYLIHTLGDKKLPFGNELPPF
jgi:hypothetical protein